MRKLEKDTLINNTTEFLDNNLSPILKGTQLTSKILSKIQDGHKQLNPIALPSYCQFPGPARIDDFNLKEGLGHVSIQPAIDALNNFKKRCIEEIKTKMQAMGPEGVKDSKLAAGAMDTIKEVYQAAKCYAKVVQEINNLIDTYVQTIDIAVNEVTNTIYKLQQEVGNGKNSILSYPNTILSLVSEETLDLLMKQTGSFELLAITNDLLNQIGQAQCKTHSLLENPERILLSLECDVTKLQCALNSLIYSLTLLNIFGHNRKTAHSMYMSETDYLSDFIYNQQTIEAANFNFSITNTGYLIDYNTIDSYNIIQGLNKMCESYSVGNVKTEMIALQSEPGYIVIPDDGIILSAGLDSKLPPNITLSIELNINSGSTIIKAEASGANSKDSTISISTGKFIKKALEQFSYSNVSRMGTSFKVILLNNETDIELGSLYRFIEPVNSDSWIGYSVMNNGVKIMTIPTLYKVTSIDGNTITLIPLSASDLSVFDFVNISLYPNATIVDVPQPYTIPSLNTHDVPNFIGQTGGLTIYISDNTYYTLIDSVGQTPSTDAIITGPKVVSNLSEWDLLTCQGLDGFTISGTNPGNFTATNGSVTYTIPSIQVSSFDMVKYHPYDEVNNPHGGERIYCKDWALYYYIVTHAQSKAEIDSIKKIHFSGVFPEPSNPISIFALSAKWGFIPDKA